jgi:hypothetical protein
MAEYKLPNGHVLTDEEIEQRAKAWEDGNNAQKPGRTATLMGTSLPYAQAVRVSQMRQTQTCPSSAQSLEQNS